MDRTNEDDVKNSGSFLLRSALDEQVEDSAMYEKRPLLREDIQFDDFKPQIGFSNRKDENEAANPRQLK